MRGAIGTVKEGQKTLDARDESPIIRSSLVDHFCEEKEVIMRSQRNSYPVFEICIRDIPET
jgi:hypothetical protein